MWFKGYRRKKKVETGNGTVVMALELCKTHLGFNRIEPLAHAHMSGEEM